MVRLQYFFWLILFDYITFELYHYIVTEEYIEVISLQVLLDYLVIF